jgi:two-component sensor histidine kinase
VAGKMTLRARIYLLVGIALAPAFALLIFDHYSSLKYQESQAEQQALRSTWLVSSELEQVFRGIESLLRAAAETPMVSKLERKTCSDYLARLERLTPSAGMIVAADDRGIVRCGASGISAVIADRDYFSAALQTDELVVGTYTIGRSSGLPVLPLAIRVQSVDGPAVLVAALRLAWIRKHFAQRFAQLPADSSLTIVDRNGIILVRLPNYDREGQSLANYNYVVNAPEPGTFRSSADKSADGIARFLGFTPLISPPRGVAIAVGYPQGPVLADVRATATRNYILLTLAAILAFIATTLGGRLFIRQPLAALLSTIEKWRNQDLSARVRQTSACTEFDQLGKAFNSMADELQGALKHKDVLLRELSHRVMNSLQMVSALFRMQSRSVQDPAAAEQFDQAIRRIDAIALTYRRMHAIDGEERIEMSAYLSELCSGLERSLMDARCIVKASSLLLPHQQAISVSLIVNELVTNAIKHGGNGREPIVVDLTATAGRCCLRVRNRGNLPDELGGNAKGFGITMIRSMVDQLRGTLEIKSSDGTTEFVISFPLTDSGPGKPNEIPTHG